MTREQHRTSATLPRLSVPHQSPHQRPESRDGSKRRPRVVYWNNIPSPYMVDRFAAVARRGNIDLEVWFTEEREPGRSWAVTPDHWQFRARYLPAIAAAGWRFP